MLEELLEQILKRMDSLEKRIEINHEETKQEFAEIHKRLSNIENKVENIPSTYEEHEKLLGRAITDIELLKRIFLS